MYGGLNGTQNKYWQMQGETTELQQYINNVHKIKLVTISIRRLELYMNICK